MNNRLVSLAGACCSVWLLVACSATHNAVHAPSAIDELPSLISGDISPAESTTRPVFAPSLSPKWSELTVLPHKRKTQYKISKLDGYYVVEANADRSASGIQAAVDIDSGKKPILSFSWRADTFAQDGDVSDRSLDDSPVRVMIAFDGDYESLSPRDKLTSDQVRMLTGKPLPYATLMYVWSNAQELESVVINPHSQRVRKIVLSNKNTAKGKWHAFRRNIVTDYERAYGKKPKGRIKAIAIMTDSDNTADKAVAYYRDIELLSR
jgi:Protein of unknown function (DUF3047)